LLWSFVYLVVRNLFVLLWLLARPVGAENWNSVGERPVADSSVCRWRALRGLVRIGEWLGR
jgi:hypothetical protein